jgi:hypothetical protein
MGLYKICEHKGRMCVGIRVSLPRWANRDIHTKAEAQAVLDEVRTVIREDVRLARSGAAGSQPDDLPRVRRHLQGAARGRQETFAGADPSIG